MTYNVFYKPGKLHDLIKEFGDQDKRRLERFLHFLRVKKTHLQAKRKNGTMDAPTGTIWGLATPGDGTKDSEGRNLPHPPQCSDFGAGPKNVKFWDGEANAYISVYEYFQRRKSFPNHNNAMPHLSRLIGGLSSRQDFGLA